MIAPLYHFDRSKPFYPLVMSYIISLHGMKEIAVQGTLMQGSIPRTLGVRSGLSRYIINESLIDEPLKESLNKLIGPLQLKCKSGKPVEASFDEVAKECAGSFDYLQETIAASAALALLVAAHQVTDGFPKNNDPLWEFLRHCRNASAHNGRFHFKDRRGNLLPPQHPAEWKSFKLDVKLQDFPLFDFPKAKGMLSLGDPIALLWDIEQAYPVLKV